jgi:uncharacterized protein (DUF779 family)
MTMLEFDIPKPTNINTQLERVKNLIENNGGLFNGDESAGTFTGKTPVGQIDGDYQVADDKITIQVNGIPSFISQSQVEQAVRGYFGA